jgi:hypothetical protein
MSQDAYAQKKIPVTSDSVPFNPIIRGKFTTDPAALVYNDTVYLYTGRDEAPKGQARYVMKEWLCYSSTDMLNWKEQTLLCLHERCVHSNGNSSNAFV